MPKPKRFPRQHTLSFSVEQSDRMIEESEANDLSYSEVARILFDAGFAKLDEITAAAASAPVDPGE